MKVAARARSAGLVATAFLSASRATTSSLDVDGERVRVPYETIQKARLKGVVDFGKERGQL